MVLFKLSRLLRKIIHEQSELDVEEFNVQLDDGWHNDSDIQAEDYIVDVPSKTIYVRRNVW